MMEYKREDIPIALSSKIRKEGSDSKEKRFVRIHPAWHSLIKYCESMKCGEIDKLKIQDGLPMIAEVIKKKINFSKDERSLL